MIDLMFVSSMYKTDEETDAYRKKASGLLTSDNKVDCTVAHPRRENLCQKGGLRGILKHQLIALLTKQHGTDYFVETGTYMGETTTGVSPLFKKCWTIEASSLHYIFASYRLCPPLRDNIEFFHGESQVVLPGVLKTIKEAHPSATKKNNIIFFLDAHFSGGEEEVVTFKSENGPCPTLQELEVIRDSGIKEAIIIIDDYSSFGLSEGYPSSDDMLEVIKQINPNYTAVYIPELDCLMVSLNSGIGGGL